MHLPLPKVLSREESQDLEAMSRDGVGERCNLDLFLPSSKYEILLTRPYLASQRK